MIFHKPLEEFQQIHTVGAFADKDKLIRFWGGQRSRSRPDQIWSKGRRYPGRIIRVFCSFHSESIQINIGYKLNQFESQIRTTLLIYHDANYAIVIGQTCVKWCAKITSQYLYNVQCCCAANLHCYINQTWNWVFVSFRRFLHASHCRECWYSCLSLFIVTCLAPNLLIKKLLLRFCVRCIKSLVLLLLYILTYRFRSNFSHVSLFYVLLFCKIYFYCFAFCSLFCFIQNLIYIRVNLCYLFHVY